MADLPAGDGRRLLGGRLLLRPPVAPDARRAVGLINDSWGGSACEAWIRRDILAADPKYAPLLKRWEQIEKDYPQAKAEYDAKLAEWKTRRRQGQGRGQAAAPAAVRTPRA